MKKQLLFMAFLTSLTACQRETDIQPTPVSLANEVAGAYRTNFYLDPSCVALSSDQMPYAEVMAETDSTVALIYTRLYPQKNSRYVTNIKLKRQDDIIFLQTATTTIGTLQTDRVFTDNGMEKQGKLLRLSVQPDTQSTFYFTGFR